MTQQLIAEDLRVGWPRCPIAQIDRLTINSKEIVVLAGPNGAGKSTTIKTLARHLAPLSGGATIDGANIFALPSRDFARQIAYVPQLIETPRAMTVNEMIMLGRAPHQRWWSWQTSSKDRDAVQAAMHKTETEELSERTFQELSGGERQRVLIAMALSQETPFLLLDEPTAHLDFKHQMHLLSLLRKLKEQGLGVLMVLHDLSLIARIADQVILLEKPANDTSGESRIAASGPPAEALTEANLKRVYEISVAVSYDSKSGLTSYTPVS